MKLLSLFKKPASTNPARELALMGARKRKEAARKRIREQCDRMRAVYGLPPVKWGKL